MKSLDANIEQQITQCIDLLKGVLGNDLLGVYIYGSSIVGGLQRYSDIDLFVVSNRLSTQEEKAKIVNILLKISGLYRSTERRPIELTIVVESEVNPWHYPPTFDFQYGEWLRSKFESGNIEPWQTKEMPDLAMLITQVLLASRTVYGQTANRLLTAVPFDDFITATVKELDSLVDDLESDTRNVLLTLARIWSTLETDEIRSKQSAAEWVIKKLPEEYKPAMLHALETSLGKESENWKSRMKLTKLCADFIIKKISTQIDLLKNSDNSNKSIKLAK
jgi:predicted nucleotidyltransferase